MSSSGVGTKPIVCFSRLGLLILLSPLGIIDGKNILATEHRILDLPSSGRHHSVLPLALQPPRHRLALPDFMLIGQQKCGTSTLWQLMTIHPRIKAFVQRKEFFWWSSSTTAHCDRLAGLYLQAIGRAKDLYGNDTRIGDFTVTYFNCECCHKAAQALNPDLRVILIVRDPIDRAVSRYKEQSTLEPRTIYYKYVAKHTLSSYMALEMQGLRTCLQRASNMSKPLAQWARYQCAAAGAILGQSLYDYFLQPWLEAFPAPGQVLVLYTEDLHADPLAALRKVEAHLGVEAFPYEQHNNTDLHAVFNSNACHGWECRSAEGVKVTHTDDMPDRLIRSLERFFAPHVAQLHALAQAGRIAPIPQAWRDRYLHHLRVPAALPSAQS